jgi:hypothetical protein
VTHEFGLGHELSRFSELRRRMIEVDPEIDERTLSDSLEGATHLKEAIAWAIRSALDDEALADGLKLRLEAMRERLARIEVTAAKKREVALAAMEEADMRTLLEPDFTASVRVAPSSVVITSEEVIPEEFWVPQPPKLDKRRILEALKTGSAVMGAELANTKVTLAIRTK